MNRLVYGKVRRVIFAIIVVGLIMGIILLVNWGTQYKRVNIGEMAYSAWEDKDYTIYILENGEYKPYLILTNDYDQTGHTLLLRKEVIGGHDGMVTDYNGTTVKEDIYQGQMAMEPEKDYKDTSVDAFLTNEFILRLTPKLADAICETSINWLHSVNGKDTNDTFKRKCFLLSNYEVGFSDTYDGATKNRTLLQYFDIEGRLGMNELGVCVPWWTRSLCYTSYGAIGYDGSLITEAGTGAKYGVRPAFTVSSSLKTKKCRLEGDDSEITVLDVDHE